MHRVTAPDGDPPPRRMLSQPRLAVVAAAFPVVDGILPRADLLVLLLPREPPAGEERADGRDGPLLVRRLRGQQGRHPRLLQTPGDGLRRRRGGHRCVRQHMVAHRRRHRVHGHGDWRLVPRPGASSLLHATITQTTDVTTVRSRG